MTISRVSGQAGDATPVDGTSGSISRAYPNNVTTGNVVWFAAMAADSSHTFVAGDLTKSAGTATIESPVLLAVRNQDTGDNYFIPVGIWAAKVSSGGSLTLQAGGLSSTAFTIAASDEITSTNGFASSGGFAGTGNNNGTSANSSSPATTGLNTAPSQSAMLVGAMGVGGPGAVTIGSPGGSWSNVYTETNVAHMFGAVADQIIAASGTAQPSWSLTGTTDAWAAVIGVIVEQASGGGGGGAFFSNILMREAIERAKRVARGAGKWLPSKGGVLVPAI